MAPILTGLGTILAAVAVATPSTGAVHHRFSAHHHATVVRQVEHLAGAPAARRRHRHAPAGASLARRRRHVPTGVASARRQQARGRGSSAGGPCPGESATPTASNLTEVRAATFCLVNRQRTLDGERPLQLSSRLQIAAQQHTESMVQGDYFSHYGPDGRTPAERMRAAGYITGAGVGYSIGENIAWGSLELATPKSIVAAWMRSPEHRANILDSSYRETAIGVIARLPESVSEGQPGAIYTQDFGVLIHG